MEDQDRARWDTGLIRRAQEFLDDSAEGTSISAYHLEAGIALHHCTAKSYAETNWPAILFLYDKLLSIHRSPVYLLNRAIVIAEMEGPAAGIRALEEACGSESLKNYHLYDATLGEFHRRAGDLEEARRCLEAAKKKTRSPHDHAIIDRRLARCT
jgi:RNA polymerase sigma-70 factor (ECF subfamily)